MPKLRFDYHQFAGRTDEGYLRDSPIVARTGILEYRNADGSIRRELRRPEEVFKADSLNSFVGKPITVDHPKGKVSSRDIGRHSVGTILTNGRQDGEFVRTDIVIHQPDKIGDRRELSVGYDVDLDETPGEWNGQRYDAEQLNIKVNHLSIVKKGRAGVMARLNLDSDEEIETETEHNQMPKIRLDNGIEYEAAPEVIHALETAKTALTTAQNKLDAATGEIATEKAAKDKLQAQVDAFPAQLEKARKDAGENLKARNELETVAKKFKIDCDGKTDEEIKIAVVQSFNKDAKLEGKSADYIQASFDIAVASRKDEAMQGQRKAANNPTKSEDRKDERDEDDYQSAYKKSFGQPVKE